MLKLPETISGRYQVRRFTEEDVPAVYALCLGNPAYYECMKSTPTMKNIREALTSLPPGRTMEHKLFAGFFQENCLTALLDVIEDYPEKGTAYIGWFMVDSNRQRKGTGTEILKEVLLFLQRQGFRSVKLGCIKGNIQGESFWKKNGFLPTGEESDTGEYTVISMHRAL